ncbi:two-component system, OmpR family, alkaline phosphatase synthesis response regulator PhoP [Fodinibius salinus]|uniref:Two-component system, OmpR family, alkaline phosphatase synthesis response regulator PhoP n=1 Tax=Fodinibius salinus TaxID=860790 RepID=A0A5D3YF42_9BACT|nr:response regulator transcription factor [Fodinibius salinus]TYP92026.1 two-component system, OmpR family, alkaline phosphatase synthesis response regulator PhoP [Fodinibius salinus]
MSDQTKKIVIVEDEPSLVFTLQDTLQNEGYNVFVAKKGAKGVEIVKKEDPDLMILDLMLPGMSGYDVCEKVREMDYTFPIIILTARDQEIDKVTGLNIGADDYITKPFGVKELLARIQARLRRSDEYTNKTLIEEAKLGPVYVDLDNAVAEHPEKGDIELTTREVELIRYLMAHGNEPVSRDALLENVWRYEFSTNTRTVDVHISKLRSKIEMEPDDPKFLVTLHGVGYMLKVGT